MLDMSLSSLVTDETWIRSKYNNILVVADHLDGFNSNNCNKFLKSINNQTIVHCEYLLDQSIKDLYKVEIKFDAELMIKENCLDTYPDSLTVVNKDIHNFLCCFNYGYHVGRELLINKLFDLKWFTWDYCTKGFVINGRSEIKKKIFNQTTKLISPGNRYNLVWNLKALSPKIQKSFFQLVSETIPDSYVPFPTEKLLFPIANSTLWVAWAQPGYHDYVEKYWGFRKYSVFDYTFDSVRDPVDRLVALTSMLEPFSKMKKSQWLEIYQKEKETIDYNFEWARSKKFLKQLRYFDEVLKR
jgi:hypothetical protein